MARQTNVNAHLHDTHEPLLACHNVTHCRTDISPFISVFRDLISRQIGRSYNLLRSHLIREPKVRGGGRKVGGEEVLIGVQQRRHQGEQKRRITPLPGRYGVHEGGGMLRHQGCGGRGPKHVRTQGSHDAAEQKRGLMVTLEERLLIKTDNQVPAVLNYCVISWRQCALQVAALAGNAFASGQPFAVACEC